VSTLQPLRCFVDQHRRVLDEDIILIALLALTRRVACRAKPVRADAAPLFFNRLVEACRLQRRAGGFA